MKKGFYWIMAAQFFSSLADNALLIAAIALLLEQQAPEWMTPMLKFFFTISYVVLAAFVAAFADSRPKGEVMFITNLVKVAGLLLMLFWVHPLVAYGVVGFGAAAYSPAKYGILTELLPPEKLVAANGWIEGTTVVSIILGTVTGGALVSHAVSQHLLAFDFPLIDTHVDTPARAAICVIIVFYLIAAWCNTRIPDTGARYPSSGANPLKVITEFGHCIKVLWTDKLGQISLAVTTLFWGAGATLQFIVLKWAEHSLGLALSQSALLQAVVAVGIAAGAISAAATIPLKKALKVLPLGVGMGVICIGMAFFTRTSVPDVTLLGVPLYLICACVFLLIVGLLAGFFVVPMNALLQHRGHVRLSAGHSIAVQNFNENLSILVMLSLYAGLLWMGLSVRTTIVLFGIFVAGSMWAVMLWNRANMRERDWTQLIGEAKH